MPEPTPWWPARRAPDHGKRWRRYARGGGGAFSAVPEVTVPPGAFEAARAPFGHDPYAFTLYGRAVSAFHGGGGGAAHPGRQAAGGSRARAFAPFAGHRSLRPRGAAVHGHGDARGRRGRAGAGDADGRSDARPDYALALRAVAALDRQAGLPTARERYGHLVEVDPEDIEARRAYGELLLDSGHVAEAQVQLQAVLEADPDDARARRHLITALSSRQQGKELAAELEAALSRDPENLDARLDLGAAYLSLGLDAQAAAAYEEVLRRRPRHTGALKLAGDLARQRGDLPKAADVLHEASRPRPPGSPSGLLAGGGLRGSRRARQGGASLQRRRSVPGPARGGLWQPGRDSASSRRSPTGSVVSEPGGEAPTPSG